MFSLVRFVLIVGLIFYYSPVRQQGDGASAIASWLAPKKGEAAASPAPAAGDPGHLETVWKALPDSAKQAVVDRILSTSGFPKAGSASSSDTLRPEDREPAASRPRM